jgi:hypothetical protein
VCFWIKKLWRRRRKPRIRFIVPLIIDKDTRMTEPMTYQVPAASTNKGLRIPTELLGAYGDKLTEDGKEAVTFTSGDPSTVFTYDVATDGSYIDVFAIGETGDDTATISDEGQSDSITLTVVAESPASLQTGSATVIDKPAAPGTVGTETSPGTTGAA